MKCWLYRQVGETEEVCSHGDKHMVPHFERILAVRTGAVSRKVLEPNQTWSKKRIVFDRPIWRDEATGELFIEDMSELGGGGYFLSARVPEEFTMSKPHRWPCRIDGELIPRYTYEDTYLSE
jgi:hypothetical protein